MAFLGATRQIQFWIADPNDSAITNASLASFVITFTRNGSSCSDALTLINQGAGAYALSYIPSAVGVDEITIDDNTNDLHYIDIESITALVDSLTVTVTQDYGSSGALRPALLGSGPWSLYAFLASDWSIGLTDPSYAAGAFILDNSGNWSLSLLPGTYNLVLVSGASTSVFKFDLVVN